MEISEINGLQSERRNASRFEIVAACRILASDGTEVVADVADISLSGVGIRLTQSLAFGCRYMLAIEPRHNSVHRLNALGTVAYCELRGSMFRIGISFVDIDPRSRLRLEELENTLN